jgi:UDP-glucuronate decarboxylase
LRNLVTGGAGFIGSHIIEKLLSIEEEVICLDNYFSGSKTNILHLEENPNLRIIKHDITEPIQLEVDKIWHFACPASPSYYQSNPIETSKISFMGTYNMLELAKRVGARFLMASSSEVYGEPAVNPQKEDYTGSVNTFSSRACYEEGKRIAETLCSDFSQQHDVSIRVARIFNTYGPKMLQNDGRVICNFIMQALKKKPLTIYGDGSQTRSFCYIDDLIKGIIKLMDSNYSKPINLGNPKESTILELAELIQEELNLKLKYQFLPLPKDDPLKRCPSIEIAKKELNWSPQIDIRDGLNNTINYYEKSLKLD